MSKPEIYVFDSSVIVAILLQEPDAQDFKRFLDTKANFLVGAPTLVETAIVLISRLGPTMGTPALLSFLNLAKCETVAFTGTHFAEAARAFEKYGKGRHPAALNMGDCNSYATAKVAGATLLYKGNDLAQTDLPPLTPSA